MVKAMKILGNSLCSLNLSQKCTLYRACVVPIATYRFRLWYFDGAQCKAALKSFTSMQWRAAIWITGIFRTSPMGGAESLVGLIPIQLYLQKLARRADYYITTLVPNHPLRALLSHRHAGEALPHLRSISLMTEAQKAKVKGSLMCAKKHMDTLTERFEPMLDLNCPGKCLLDKHREAVSFMELISRKEEEVKYHLDTLDWEMNQASKDNRTVLVVTDTSLSHKGKFQAVSSAFIHHRGSLIKSITRVAGHTTAPDAELMAISVGIGQALALSNVDKIFVFTNSIASAKRVVDPSIYSGQA